MTASVLRRPLFWSFAAGIASTALYAAFCSDIYRDVSGRYAPMARAFSRGDWSLALDVDYSPLTPCLGGAVSFLTGLEPYAALCAGSGILYVLAIIPLYSLLKSALGDSWAAEWGCLLYVLAPKIIRIGCSGLLEAGRNFMLISAFALLFSLYEERRLWKSALLGLALSGLCLARSECAAWLPFFALLLLLLHWRSKGFLRSFEALKGLAAPAAVSLGAFLLCSLPRLLQVSASCGFPAFDRKQADFARHLLGLPGYESIASLDLTIDPEQRTHGLFAPERLYNWLDCLVNGAYPIYFGMALIAIWLLWKARKISFELWALLGASVFNALLYLFLNLSPRYFNATVLLLMPFSVWLALDVWKRIAPRYRALFLCSMALAAAAQLVYGLGPAFSKEGREEKAAGLWLKANFGGKAHEGPLLIASSDTAVNYWAEAACAHIDKSASAVRACFADADFIVVEKRRKALLRSLEGNSLFKAVAWPGERRIAIFARN